MKCKNCAKVLLDTRQKSCSIDYQDDYIAILEFRIKEATKNDPSYTDKMSKSEMIILSKMFVYLNKKNHA